jgi:hemoglobin
VYQIYTNFKKKIFFVVQTLYEIIGEERLAKLIDRFYDRVFTSEKIGPLFQTDRDLVKKKQRFFLTQFLGGPQLYNEEFGHPRMRMRHMPHKITAEAKDEWLKCMKEAIDEMEIQEEIKIALYNCFPQIAQHMVNS